MAINQLKTAIGRQYVDNSTAAMIKYRSNMITEYEATLTTRVSRVH